MPGYGSLSVTIALLLPQPQDPACSSLRGLSPPWLSRRTSCCPVPWGDHGACRATKPGPCCGQPLLQQEPPQAPGADAPRVLQGDAGSPPGFSWGEEETRLGAVCGCCPAAGRILSLPTPAPEVPPRLPQGLRASTRCLSPRSSPPSQGHCAQQPLPGTSCPKATARPPPAAAWAARVPAEHGKRSRLNGRGTKLPSPGLLAASGAQGPPASASPARCLPGPAATAAPGSPPPARHRQSQNPAKRPRGGLLHPRPSARAGASPGHLPEPCAQSRAPSPSTRPGQL